MESSIQEKLWLGEFGKDYTERNVLDPDKMDKDYIETFNVSRTFMNDFFWKI